MTRSVTLATVAVVALGGAIAAPLPATVSKKREKKAEATLVDAAGTAVGTVRLKAKDDVVRIEAKVRGLAPGFHGFHVHGVGSCVAPAFTSAGSHLNPGGGTHPSHAGDMPVLLINGDGTATASFTTDRFGLDDVFDGDASALIVHANPDNYANIPTDRYDPDPDATTLATGDAGGRIACGVLRAH